MAKYWTAGQVKTRLGASIGMAAAAALHRLFVLHLAESLANTGDRRIISVTPGETQPALACCLPSSWETADQGDGNLGDRMARWFRRTLAANSDHAILIGADCPTLKPAEIALAAESLTTHDVVLGPAADGGYYLIGLRGPWEDRLESLFRAIQWSSDQVCRLTHERAAQAGLSVMNLEVREDVDTINELDRLRSQLWETSREDPRDADLARRIDEIVPSSRGLLEPAPARSIAAGPSRSPKVPPQ